MKTSKQIFLCFAQVLDFISLFIVSITYSYKVTGHSIIYDGVATTITVAHSDCQRSAVEETYLICDGVDIMMYMGCPLTEYALNISYAAKLRVGAKAVAAGYLQFNDVSIPRLWE